MKESCWEDCLRTSSARVVSSDTSRANSLIETAKERIKQVSEITPSNSNFVFEDYYTSVLEMLQAIAFKKGFNVLNHICLGYFLRDFLKREDLYRLFDDLRFKRNSLTYYGNRMDYATSKNAIDACNRLIRELSSD